MIDPFEGATTLRWHFEGKKNPDTLWWAKRLAELHEHSGNSKEAAYTRNRFGLD